MALRQPAEDDGPGLGGGICRGIANELHLECGQHPWFGAPRCKAR